MNETLTRLLSGIVYIVLLLFAISYSTTSFFILFGVFMVIAINEFCNLVKIPKIAPFLIGSIIYCFFTFGTITDVSIVNSLLAITLVVSIKAMAFLFSKEGLSSSTIDKYLYTLGYIILSFVFITKIPFGINGYNPKIIIGIFILIWTNDTFAYIVGKSIGKNKLFERISPKKTIEGFIGGLVFSILASILISKYFIGSTSISTMYIWIGIAFIASIFGTIGDLVESKFKRIAQVKDSGNIMPGHGGVLDRLDSIIFVAPFVYLFYQILYYVS
ncbi:phosphatidate cytidylyltransferase [uncultured Flavobacterium sp.]|uniref:phosphatidate cytidylyltransferase n=1 Tax=uncultured Flavobacterium sp. TaxID=165435 RepID=UPI0030EE6B42|tara:strand:+ start:374 stop:1192 length:819 start_codon:yes stop_codon:yes gene_type:complete